jgi:hypothetical protein
LAIEYPTLLKAYCCHAASAAELSRLMATMDVSDPRFDGLSKMRARETKAMLHLASRLLLLPSKRERPLPATLPWQREDEH